MSLPAVDVRIWRLGARFRALAGRWLWFAVVAVEVQGATLTYTESIEIEWGEVVVVEDGMERPPQKMWFTRRLPALEVDGRFSLAERSELTNCLQVCLGTAGGTPVWRIDNATFNGRFKDCVVRALRWNDSTFEPPTPPDAWQEGEPLRATWSFEMVYEPPDNAPPTLEMALLVEEVPLGEAWQVPLASALTNPVVQRYANVADRAKSSILQNAEWTTLYLVSQPSLAAPGTPGPRVTELTDLPRFAVPIAYGLRALAEISTLFDTNRSMTGPMKEALLARLDPNHTNAFDGAPFWFPESGGTRQKLEVTDLRFDPRKLLVQVAHPTGAAFEAERVLPDVLNEWAIRVGPFGRLRPPLARVEYVKGKQKTHPVQDLENLLQGRTNALRRYTQSILKLEQRLNEVLISQPLNGTNFFWLPDLAGAGAKQDRAEVLRDLEKVPFTDGIQPGFRTNQFVFAATYRPAPVSFKLGASFNPEHGFGGSLEAGWSGGLRPGDLLEADVSVAQRSVEGDFSYSLPYHRSLDRLTSFSTELFGRAGRDDNYRLGSLSSRRFQNEYQSGGIQHEVRRRGASQRWEWVWQDSVLWEAQKLSQSRARGSESNDGLLLRHRQIWSFDPRGESIAWEHDVAPEIVLGPRAGWDHSFVMGGVAASSKASFLGPDRNAMYAGLRAAVGAGTDDTPPPLLYRFGDSDRLPGLEPGQFSGNRFVHGEVSYGVNLSHYLLGRLFRKKGNETAPAANQPEKAAVPENLQGIHLKIFAEAGAIEAADGQPALDQSDKVVSSFGVAFEKSMPGLRGAAFAIGYAWSPDNIIRSDGRFFTGLSWSF